MQMASEKTAWYAVRVRARQEALVAAALTGKGYDVLLPQYRCRKRWSDRVKEVTLPLFPGYLFSRFDIGVRLPILTTPGVFDIVAAGETFLPVDPEEIAAIHRIIATGATAEPWPYLRIGRRVRIVAGPLCGLEGVLARVDDRRRVVVSVTMLQRSVAVQIDPADAFPADEDDAVLNMHSWQPDLAAVGA